MIRTLILWLALALPAAADSFPALYEVTGVAADDVLNIRAQPDAGSAILGTFPPDATHIEVLAVTPAASGVWAFVTTGEVSGYVASQFLQRQPGPDWFSLQTGFTCRGTEPFWSLIVTEAASALYETPEGDRLMPVQNRWPGRDSAPRIGVSFHDGWFLTVTADQCSDGMSDRLYRMTATLFMTDGGVPSIQSGCCTLTP